MWSKNTGTKLFPWCVGKIEEDLTNTKKNFTSLWSTCCSFQKNSRLFTIFSRLYLYFPDFFQVWKIARPISRIFQEFKTLYEPWLYNLKLLNINVFKFCFRPPLEQSLFCLLDRGGEKQALPVSRQTFEVATAQTSGLVNLVISHQTDFF